MALNLIVKSSLHKGVHGVSQTPLYWPTPYYNKRVGAKPMICPICQFQAIKPQQIELHHPTKMDYGPKAKRNAAYYQTQNLQPMCANCHSLEHRRGDILLKKCGQWHQNLPGNQTY